jgi:transposase
VNTFPNIQAGQRRRRRIHSVEFKADAVAKCMQPGMSMAAVAMACGVNANLLRHWVREAELTPLVRTLSKNAAQQGQAPQSETLFVPLGLTTPSAPSAPTPCTDIRIELQHCATAVTVAWPASAASECAAWLREFLR